MASILSQYKVYFHPHEPLLFLWHLLSSSVNRLFLEYYSASSLWIIKVWTTEGLLYISNVDLVAKVECVIMIKNKKPTIKSHMLVILSVSQLQITIYVQMVEGCNFMDATVNRLSTK